MISHILVINLLPLLSINFLAYRNHNIVWSDLANEVVWFGILLHYSISYGELVAKAHQKGVASIDNFANP